MSSRVIIMREATIRIVKMLAEKEVKVTQRGARAYVEYNHVGRPIRVNIPYMPDDASEELLDAIQGFMDHEVAHILFTDFHALVEAKKQGVARLHNIIEDSFIERRMAEHFAGSGLNLRNVGSFFLKSYTDVEIAKAPENTEGLLFVPAVRAWAGQSVFADYMADKWHLLSKVTAALGDSVKEVANCKTSMDCLALSIKFRDLLDAAKSKRPKPEEPEEPEESHLPPPPKGAGSVSGEDAPDLPDDIDDDFDGEEDADEEGEEGEEGADDEGDEGDADDTFADATEEALPEEGEGDEEFKVSTEEEKEESETEDEGEDADLPDMKEVDHRASVSKDEGEGEGEDGKGEDDSDDGDEGPSLLEEMEEKMGEKDYDDAIADALTSLSVEGAKEAEYMIYTTELDVIEPMPVSSGRGYWSEGYLKTMTDTVDHMVGPLQKDLERAIAARSASTWSSGHRSGRLHPSALARLTAFQDDRVFRRKHVNESKDVAVSLLVDCSGSMSGSRIKTAAYAAYGLAAVLDRMMISSEVLGFTTESDLPAEMRAEEKRLGVHYARRQSLYIPILKAFNERLTAESKKRFAALPTVHWLCENVDGESVQIAANRLAQRREKRKILIVLSDGQPACPGDFRQLAAHLKKSVKDVERSGIDVIGIGIESEAPRHFYSKHVVLHNVADLPTVVIGELRKLLMK